VATFSPDRWRTLSPYLDEALGLSRERRATWLAGISARDKALATELETLLAEYEHLRESGFLESALRWPGAPSRPESSE
jgi:hypothetical protein